MEPLMMVCVLLIIAAGIRVWQQRFVSMFILLHSALNKRERKVGGLWMELQAQMEQPVNSPLFFRSFRMSPEKFFTLVDIVAPHIVHACCPPAQFVGVCLYRLATNATVWMVSEEFDVAEGSVVNYTAEFAEIMTSRAVLSQWLKLPRGQALVDVMQQFRAWCGLPNVAGAADGKIFKLSHAPDSRFHPAEYWCVRKACYGLNVLGVVDSRGTFVFANAEYPGRVHDSVVFSASSLFADLCSGAVWGAGIDGGLRPCLLVDSAYPLLPFTLKTFHHARNVGSVQERAFDHAVCRGRNPIERAWARLVERFQICCALPAKELSGVAGIIVTCMVLHNFCESFDPMAWDQPVLVQDDVVPAPTVAGVGIAESDLPPAMLHAGRVQRDQVVAWLASHALGE
jgi:hypothetical protein